ncbi:hypothetical protein HNR44_000040 [Geomicrobium halophilum]|uniref:Uncharacterized protein n=1 Tax=Geomicrobium halophilum TaxID=549000 RepID=A0A841PP93_9BACL|nr:hypothetical protein [Geomicrobium halophilum]MBB6448091.1 hypothetical protein [Geomicrobium halophilum]
MNKKLLYGALSAIFSVGMLAACGDMEEDQDAPAGSEDESGMEEDSGAEDEEGGLDL